MSTRIYVISGYLGSGKTTFINNLLDTAPPDLKIMVLVNDLGSISIDRKLIKADPFNVIDLSGGCVCCGLFTELMASLRFALEDLKADVVLIEATGLAVPRQIVEQALTPAFEQEVEFGGIITVVDAGALLAEEPPILRKQLEAAHIIILNKIDLIDSGSLMKARDKLKAIAPDASVVLETSFGKVGFSEMCSLCHVSGDIDRARSRSSSQIIDSTVGFQAICRVGHAPISSESLLQFYAKHRARIVRSKGFILTDRGSFELQLSGSMLELKTVEKPIARTELVLIVLEEDKELIEDELTMILGREGQAQSRKEGVVLLSEKTATARRPSVK